MSGLQRKGTVSKSSGPVHVNSYALKGVPIKYTPPFFLPDQLTLPPSWAPPTLPSDDIFRYDYSKERQVLEQARARTMSLAAEAQAREKRELEEEKKRRIEAAAAAERAKVMSSSNALPPPLIPSPGSAILTPKPASQPQTAPLTNGIDSAPASNDTTANVPIGDSSKLIKPLGEMSLTEFEGDNFNPFDSASLQAINDMEILQTISLLPIPENSTLPPQTSTSSSQISGHSGSATSQGQTVVTDSRPPAAIAAGRVPLSSGSVANGPPVQLNFSGPQPLAVPSRPALPVSSVASTNRPSISPHLGSPSSGVVQQAQSVPLPNPSLSPHPVLPPIGTNITHSHSEPANPSTLHPVPIPPPSSQPGNPLPPNPLPPTLPMFPPSPQGTNSPPTVPPSLPPPSSNPPTSSSPSSSPSMGIIPANPTPSHPIPLPRTSLSPYPPLPQPSTQPLPPQATILSTSPSGTIPGLPPPQQSSAVGQAANNDGVCTLIDLGGATTTPLTTQKVSTAQKPPVPKPRTVPVTSQQVSNSTYLPYPTGPSPFPRPPVAGPSPHPPAVAPKPSPVRSTVQDRANSIMASMPGGQLAIGRPGLGVPVLPSINPSNPMPPASSRGQSAPSLPPSTSAFSPPTFPTPQLPPPYPQPSPAPARSITPPPPYFPSQDQASRRYSQPLPQPVPSHYTLPDIQASLSAEEKREVESIAGMGFPAPRVARAVKRFNSDRTKVLDFLILVGSVEESSGSRGDSAETALTVCSDDDIKAKRYLQKVTYYRESGFSEKNIHEAYEKAGSDWDRALDILTQDTT